MSTSNIVDFFVKLAKILCRIINIVSLVSIAVLSVGLVLIAVMSPGSVLGSAGFITFVNKLSPIGVGALSDVMSMLLVCSIGEFIISKKYLKHYENVLNAGTIFTFEGAEELKKLGIFSCVLTIIVFALNNAVHYVFSRFTTAASDTVALDGTFYIGVVCIVVSVIIKLATEKINGKDNSGETKDE